MEKRLFAGEKGGPKQDKRDKLSHNARIFLAAKVGTYLRAGEPLAEIHAASEKDAAAAEEELLDCYTFGDEKPVRPPFIRGIVS